MNLNLQAIEEAQAINMPHDFEKAKQWHRKYVSRCGCGVKREHIVRDIHNAKAQFCNMKYATDDLLNECNKCLELVSK